MKMHMRGHATCPRLTGILTAAWYFICDFKRPMYVYPKSSLKYQRFIRVQSRLLL